MASKRRRKLQLKASRSTDQKMEARRDNFNENLWRFGPPVITLLVLLVVIFFVFIYEPGNPRPEEWTLEEADTGVIYSSKDYYDGDQLTLVEFFQSQCGHCQNQAPVLKDINANYSSQINMFSIGGYKLGSNTDALLFDATPPSGVPNIESVLASSRFTCEISACSARISLRILLSS